MTDQNTENTNTHATGPVDRRVDRCQPKCDLGKSEPVKDADFGVKFGEIRECRVCGWRLYDDWTAMRAGSVERWLPPFNTGDQR